MSVRIATLITVMTFVAGCAAQSVPGPVEERIAIRSTDRPSTFDADRLDGLDGTSLANLLGQPSLLRRDGDAEIWQYVDDTCILDLFLYAEGGRKAVDYVEARGLNGSGAKPSVQSCLDDVLAGRPALTS